MSELELKRFKKENKDIIERIQQFEVKIAKLKERVFDPEETDATLYIEKVANDGAIMALESEKRKYEKILSMMENGDKNLIDGLFE